MPPDHDRGRTALVVVAASALIDGAVVEDLVVPGEVEDEALAVLLVAGAAVLGRGLFHGRADLEGQQQPTES
jgi:hypothetical protein